MAEKTNELDQLPSIYETVRGYIAANGVLNGYSLSDFDAVYTSFRGEAAVEDFLQELYDSLPKTA